MKSELERLQGTWNISTLEVDGRPLPSTGSQVVVKGDSFTSLGMGAIYKGKLVVDVSLQPWAIDMKFTAGPEKGNVNRGIFELDGDKWRLCLQMTGEVRPTAFVSRPGTGVALETLERVDPAAARKDSRPGKKLAAISADFPSDPVPELAGEWAMTACSSNGEPLKAEFLKMGRRVARGSELTVFMSKQVMLKAKYAIDRRREPNTIDYLLTHGPAAGQRQFGIFELKGGSLRACFAAPGKPRPADFTSVPGDGHTVTGWKRLKA